MSSTIPAEWYCPECSEAYKENGPPMIACDCCDFWYHFRCVGLVSHDRPQDEPAWYCAKCRKALVESCSHSQTSSINGEIQSGKIQRHKQQNTVSLIRRREISNNYSYRTDVHIISRLVTSPKRRFVKKYSYASNLPIYYENECVYFGRHEQCYSIISSQLLYQVRCLLPMERITNANTCIYAVWCRPLSENCIFLGVTNRNRLLCLNSLTGDVLHAITLPMDYRFKDITWVTEAHTLVVLGKKRCGPCVHSEVFAYAGSSNGDSLTMLCVFDTMPFQHVATFVVQKEVFGDYTNVALMYDILIVNYHGQLVRFYNLHNHFDNLRYLGRDEPVPDTVAISLIFEEPPPIIFELKCRDHLVSMGGFPLHYVYSLRNRYHIRDIRTGHEVISDIDLNYDHERVMSSLGLQHSLFFHPDDYGRLIQVEQDLFRVLKFVPQPESECVSLVQDFYVRVCDDRNESKPTVTSSGRLVKQVCPLDQYTGDRIQEIQHEYDMDLLVVTVGNNHVPVTDMHKTAFGSTGHLFYFDNTAGRRLLKVTLDDPWNESDVIVPDLDHIIHISNNHPNFHCHVYRLTEVFEEPNEKDESHNETTSAQKSISLKRKASHLENTFHTKTLRLR